MDLLTIMCVVVVTIFFVLNITSMRSKQKSGFMPDWFDVYYWCSAYHILFYILIALNIWGVIE